MTFEILIPLRNPTAVFSKTIESLCGQTDRDFSVLISDNFSTNGQEHIESALGSLRSAGIMARRVSPPFELERVEHWNWLHYQSGADWLKPLFVGDWLDPIYMARLREVVIGNPACRYVFSNGYAHLPDGSALTAHNAFAGRFRPPTEMQDIVLRFAMQFGPPSSAAYERMAFFALGGYPTTLPITADSLFFCALAARFGAYGIQDKLCHFNLHAARFSIGLPGKRRDTFRETMTYYLILGYQAWCARKPFPVIGYLRMFARATRNHLRGD